MQEQIIKHLSDTVTVVLGDCLAIDLPKADAVISDPPYGMSWDADNKRFTGGRSPESRSRCVDWGDQIQGDDKPFNPEPWLDFPRVVLFGSNHYAQRLPVGTTLVWIKRYKFGTFLSDAEIAWMKGGHGVYCHHDTSMNGAGKNFEKLHPTQKPIGVMAWCMERAKVPDGTLVLDPYMGSGTTGIVCIRTGRRFFGVEIIPKYFDAACKRLDQELSQGRLF